LSPAWTRRRLGMTRGPHPLAAAGARERGGGLVAVLGRLGRNAALAAAGRCGLLLGWLRRWAEKEMDLG
jgi:hypothetical protein